MEFLTSIFRRRTRRRTLLVVGSPRKRPGRSFSATFGSLERRALLTTLSPVFITPTTTTAMTSVAVAAEVMAAAAVVAAPVPPPPLPDRDPNANDAIIQPPHDPSGSLDSMYHNWKSSGSTLGPSRPDRHMDHVSLAVISSDASGKVAPEFALANASENLVVVRAGVDRQPTVLTASEGINNPQSVVLGDLNGDGIPDLIVANSGGNNILVFPGLAGGHFGPEVNGGQGFAVGKNPVAVTLGNLVGNSLPDLIVSNEGSNSISILQGQGLGAQWTATLATTIADVGIAPVKTALVTFNDNSEVDLFVCNSGSNNVAVYQAPKNGGFDTAHPLVYDVGTDPVDLLIARFDQRPEMDMITVNLGSDNLTFVGGVLTTHPTIQSVPSGGTSPDAAFAIDLNHNGVMDLVVANSGDGHLAVLQGTNDGIQLAGVITQADLPIPTGLAPSSSNGQGFDFFAASAGQDAAQLLHFELQTLSPFLGGTVGEPINQQGGEGNNELVAGLVPFGNSALGMIAVFWGGNPESEALAGDRAFREPLMITALYAPTEGQGGDSEAQGLPSSTNGSSPTLVMAPPKSDEKVDPSVWVRFVFGIDQALNGPGTIIDAVATRDAPDDDDDDDRSKEDLARNEFEPLENSRTDLENAVDKSLRLFWPDHRLLDEPHQPLETAPRPQPIPELNQIDAPTPPVPLVTVPLISTAVLLSTRLILSASPPRPPTSHKAKKPVGTVDSDRGQPDRL